MTDDPLIVQAIHRYRPEWEPPKDTGREWVKTLCPFHRESVPSAAVSYEHNAFRCLACDAKGDAIAIIRQNEEMTFAEAKRIATQLASGSDGALPPEPARKPGRRVFEDAGFGVPVSDTRRERSVPSRVRGRSTPWT